MQSLKNDAKGLLHVLEMDTSNEESIEASATRLKDILGVEGGVDYLINNAGLVSSFQMQILPSSSKFYTYS